MTYFRYQKLRAQTNHSAPLSAEVIQARQDGCEVWGVFTGLFGLASNELIVVTLDAEQAPDWISDNALDNEVWRPTARPLGIQPCSRPGLYVFRRFDVKAGDVDEVVGLSRQAWETFEAGEEYAAEPQGLFCPEADEAGVVRMMLVTWYDGFESWDRSRTPAAAAQDNFRRRHALTLTTYAVATRLVIT